MDIENKKCKIKPISPIQMQALQSFMNIDKIFRGLIQQEDQVNMNIKGAKLFLHDIRKNRNMLDDFLVPTGNGMMRHLKTPNAKKDYIGNINKNLRTLENQYAGVLEQHSHKSDEYGEAIILLFKNMASMLKNNYDFTDDSLIYLLHDRDNAVTTERTQKEIDADIKKALEV